MIRRRLNYTHFYVRLTMLLLPPVSFCIAAYIRFFSGIFPPFTVDFDPAGYWGLLLFTTVVWAVVVEHYNLGRLDQMLAARPAGRVLSACFVTYLTVMAATFVYRSVSYSRAFVFFSAVVQVLLFVVTLLGFRSMLDRKRRQGKSWIRVLMIGTDQFAERAARSLRDRALMPCTIVGFVHLPSQEVAVSGSRVWELDESAISSVSEGLDEIVIAIPSARFAEIPNIMARLEPLCVPVRAVMDLGDGVLIHEQLFRFGDLLMLDLRATPAEFVPYLLMKRGFDLVFSILALILCAPLMALIALAIRLDSPGPALFRQKRVGLNGQIFWMYKFRTMRVGQVAESDTRWTTAGDPRRTRLGGFLRRTNLDELPQFFNVIKGEMSVVGPRPERPHFVNQFLKEVSKYNSRHYLKVGITGWAQVNGWRGDTSIARRVEHDLYYLQNWSLSFDLRIILLTLLRGFSGKHAY